MLTRFTTMASNKSTALRTLARVCAGLGTLLIIFAGASVAHAQGQSSRVKITGGGISLPAADSHVDTGKLPQDPPDPTQTKRVEYAMTPIPVINPTIGNGAGAIGMVVVRLDTDDHVSPPSVFGGGAMYTSSGSWAWGVGTRLFLREDRFRIDAGGGDGLANYDYYGTGHGNGADGVYLPVSLSGSLFLIEPKVRVLERIYVGPRYHRLSSAAAIDFDEFLDEVDPTHPSLPDIPEIDADTTVAALGLRVQRDTRDNQFYPLAGSFADAKLDFYASAFGSDRDYQHYEIAYQAYYGIGAKNVIAYRADVCMVQGRAPFYALCNLGNSKDIRGYAVGQYQDHRMIVGQVEYRRELFWRFGVVAFFGLGEVADTFGDFNGANLLPGGGAGLRFTLAEQDHINIRVDYAWGRDSSAFYMGLLEAF
jgi:hypothetical protein